MKKPQISPLRYAPVEMTKLWLRHGSFSMEDQLQYPNNFAISTGA
jgi:hypothetical protein